VLEKPKSIVDHTVKVEMHRPLFGFGEQQTADDEAAEDEFAIDEESVNPHMVDHILGSSTDCGICYKQGFVPGYVPLGYEHRLLGVHNVSDIYGYFMNRTCSPTRFELEDYARGYIDFEIDVPLYFHHVKISIRNNTSILPEPVMYDKLGAVLTLDMLRLNAGATMTIRIKEAAFTHAVIDFDIGAEPLRTNLSQGNKTLDWTMFDTFGTLQAILPVTIPEVAVGDVLHVPSRRQTFKVTDITFLRTAKDYALDWSVNIRVLQPQESLKHLHVGSSL
jgi:hypothetical protein